MICDRVKGTKPRNASKRKNTRRSANGQRPREGMRASRELLAGQLGQANPWERGAEGPGRAGGTWLGGRGQCILTPWRESWLLRSRAADAPCVGRPTETGWRGEARGHECALPWATGAALWDPATQKPRRPPRPPKMPAKLPPSIRQPPPTLPGSHNLSISSG